MTVKEKMIDSIYVYKQLPYNTLKRIVHRIGGNLYEDNMKPSA